MGWRNLIRLAIIIERWALPVPGTIFLGGVSAEKGLVLILTCCYNLLRIVYGTPSPTPFPQGTPPAPSVSFQMEKLFYIFHFP